MKRIAIFTTTRAEFGILTALLKEIKTTSNLEFMLFVGGAHLTSETGKTINEIIDSGFKISATFDYLLNLNDDITLSKSIGLAVIELADIFHKYEFDLVCILGDRFELLAIVLNAILFRKPIIHIHGGEKTEGAIDEQVRHMITKAAHLHFVACDEYAQNVINMGESSWRVFNTGALTVDNIKTINKIGRKDLFSQLGLDQNKVTVLLTYHPVTLEMNISSLEQIKNLFDALDQFNFQIIITAPSMDNDREQIHNFILQQIKTKSGYYYFESLGVIKYLNLLPQCKFVIGNSSSGILEVPYFRIPTVNVGERQKGRIMHDSVINTGYTVDSIKGGINKALSQEFIQSLVGMKYKFGEGNSAQKMVEILKTLEINEQLLMKQLTFPKE
jgi:GDP/UDP-N,N'-diacetylbacillosamine 2-epimerase (hydrolysing)